MKNKTYTLFIWCPDCLGDNMGCFDGEKIEFTESSDYEYLVQIKDEQAKKRNGAPFSWEIVKALNNDEK
jgi:hypothetical protein